MNKKERNSKCRCPECGEYIDLEDYLYEDEVFNCDSCWTELKIVSVNPPKLKVVRNDDHYEEDFSDDYYSTDDGE